MRIGNCFSTPARQLAQRVDSATSWPSWLIGAGTRSQPIIVASLIDRSV